MDAARLTAVTPEGFGDRLRQLRSAAGLSQDELARRSGLSPAAVGALERGTRRAPWPETIALLAHALALSHCERADLEQTAQRGRARTRMPRPEALAATHNLPYQLTSFVGRTDQIEQITRSIESSRLVTIVGSGGVGKTRMALEVAMQLAMNAQEEVRFVDLAPLQNGNFVTGRIAGVLDVRLSDSDESPESLAMSLQTRRVLIVLDNCEHLIADATRIVRVLLQRCPHVKILATTREHLGIMGEVVHRLPPLTLPNDNRMTIAEARSASALELFLQRTHLVDPDLKFTDRDAPSLIDVCRRLEGIPLAIELVAAHVSTLGLETLSQRLEAALGVAPGTRGIPDRQQTMRNTIAWSHDLLTEPERMLMRRMGIFAGGCTLAAAESVCAETDLQSSYVAGLLAHLVDKSLVNAVIDGKRMRYMLLDSTRAFAQEQLTGADEQIAFSRRHAQWLAAFGEQVEREYLSQPNLVWLDEFASEIDNVRSALEWALHSGSDEDVLLAGRIAGSYRGLWLIPGWFGECRRWVNLVLERINQTSEPLVAFELLMALSQTVAGFEWLTVMTRVVNVIRQIDDPARLAHGLANLAGAYCNNGLLVEAQDTLDEGRETLAKARMLELPPPQLDRVTYMYVYVSYELSLARGEFAEARAFIEEAKALKEGSSDEYSLIRLSSARAELEFVAGDTVLAVKYSEEAVRLANAEMRSPALLANALCVDASIRLSLPDIAGGEAAAFRAYRIANPLKDEMQTLISLQVLAAAAIRLQRPQIGARLIGSIEAWREATKNRRTPFEAATYKLLVTSLEAELGPDMQMHFANGRRLNLELAAEEVLSLDFRGSDEMGS